MEDIYNYGTIKRVNKLQTVLANRQRSLTIVMENINDPHNISACMRSCDAVGILEIYLVYHGGQAFPTTSKTSSASANKWIDCHKFGSIQNCYDALRKQNKKIFTTHLSKAAVSVYDLDLTQNVALVFGNEHSGVSKEAAELADGNFLIPQIGVIQSLNISVACAVSLFEAFRQRQKKAQKEQELSEIELNNKLKQWLLK